MRLLNDLAGKAFVAVAVTAALGGCTMFRGGGDNPASAALPSMERVANGPQADYPMVLGDPYKVDGLARVLEEHARTRQVVVFTHDERLPEAVRRLRIEATVLAVERGPRSSIRVSASRDPVSAYLHEARALLYNADQLGPRAMARVIPMYCRNALEAYFRQAYRHKALSAGVPHAEVHRNLAEVRGTTELAALGLFGDRNAAKDVHKQLRKLGGEEGVALFNACKEGAHEGWDHQHRARVDATHDLIRKLVRAP